MGGWSKQIIHTPKHILEGNGVVFENFTINHGNFGGVKTNYSYPPNILEGNGAVFENYH